MTRRPLTKPTSHEGRKFVAFISYRQARPDRKVAIWLQRAIERYRIPRPMRRERGWPSRPGIVFRDEEELAASADLGAALASALARSQSLVVVCSPRTRQQPVWINTEIRRFRELNPGLTVAALLMEGDPKTSFPSALYDGLPPDSEPLAADIRPFPGEWKSTRRRLAKLRILASILGCEFDELRRRDDEARLKAWLMMWALGLVVLAVVAGLAAWAFRERGSALKSLASSYQFRAVDLWKEGKTEAAVAFTASAARIDPSASFGRAFLPHLMLFDLGALPEGLPMTNAGGLSTLALSHSGRFVFTAGPNQRAQVWSVPEGRPVGPGFPTPGVARVSTYGRDDQLLAFGTDTGIIMGFDYLSGKLVGPFNHKGVIGSLEFSPDGASLLSASGSRNVMLVDLKGSDRMVRRWDLESGALSAEKRLELYPIAAAFSPEGDAVLTAHLRGAQRWRLPSFEAEASAGALGHESHLRQMLLSRDGRVLVTLDYRVFRVWNARTLEPLSDLQEIGGLRDINEAALSPNGSYLAMGLDNGEVSLWDISKPETPDLLKTLIGHNGSVRALHFSQDDRLLITGSDDTTARLWSVPEGESIVPPIVHNEAVEWVFVREDGQSLLTASGDGTVRAWTYSSIQPRIANFRGNGVDPRAAWSAAGDLLVVGSRTGELKWLDPRAGHELYPASSTKGPVFQLHFGDRGRRLIVVPGTGRRMVNALQPEPASVLMLDAASGQPLGVSLEHDDVLLDAVVSADGAVLATATANSKIRLWDVATGLLRMGPIQCSNIVSSLAMSEGARVLLVDGSQAICVLSTDTGEFAAQPVTRPLWPFSTVPPVLSSKGNRFATKGIESENEVDVFSLAAGSVRKEFTTLHRGKVTALALSPDNQVLATGSEDGTARLWNFQTGQSLGEPIDHGSPIVRLAFSPDGQRLASADAEGWRVTDTGTGLPLGSNWNHGGHPSTLDFSPDGQHVRITTMGEVELWELPAPSEPVPAWFLDFVEEVINLRVDARISKGRALHRPSLADLRKTTKTWTPSQRASAWGSIGLRIVRAPEE